jgi:hypothetical protein
MDLEYQSLAKQFGEEGKFIIYSNTVPLGKAFLALVSNSLKLTPIIIFTEDQILVRPLLAVDLNAKTGSGSRGAYHVFMILSVPPESKGKGRTLHRVGISSNVWIPDDQNLERARE